MVSLPEEEIHLVQCVVGRGTLTLEREAFIASRPIPAIWEALIVGWTSIRTQSIAPTAETIAV